MSRSEVSLFNEDVARRFALLNRKGRLAHAYLFVGARGTGKGETALAVAKLVNCETPEKDYFCDRCPTCLKVNSGNHPDFFIIDHAPGEPIKIEEIRELLRRNRLKSYMAAKKVFIIKNIEDLTLAGANAFLKTLEEPTPDTLLLLTTCAPEKNLDTIKSRCHQVNFGLGNAFKIQETRFIEGKNDFITSYILNRPGEEAIKSLLADKIQTKGFLNILSSWIRDAILLRAGVDDERIIHADRLADLKIFTEHRTFEELNTIDRSATGMHKMLADNLNIKLPLLIIGEQLWNK